MKKKRETYSARLARFMGNHLWKLLALAPVGMIFGEVASIPILDWYYEITLTEILILATSVLFIAYIWARESKHALKIGKIGAVLALFYVLMIGSLLWVDSGEKWIIAIRIATYQFAMFFLAINLIKTKEQVRTCLALLLIPGVVVAYDIISTVLSIPPDILPTLNRSWITTQVGALSFAAALVALFVPVVLGVYHVAEKNWIKVLGAFSFVILYTSLLFAAGKAAILSATLGILLIIKGVKESRIFTVVLMALAIISFVGFANAGGVQNGEVPYAVQRIQDIGVDSSTEFRLLELNAAKNVFLSNPILGVGVGSLKKAYLQETGFYEGEANNIIVQIATELGIIGLLMALLVIITIGKESLESRIQRRDSEFAYIAGAIALVMGVNAMFEVTLVGLLYGILALYLLGLIVVYVNAKK